MQLDRIGCSKDYRDAASCESSQQGCNILLEEKSFSAEGLVQQDRAWRSDQRLPESKPLYKAWRQTGYASRGVDVEANLAQRRFDL